MGFSDFHGNAEIIHRLRDMLARDHFPHAVALAGGAGSGKYTLALMLAQTMNCLGPAGPQGLKPTSSEAGDGTAEAVPFPKHSVKGNFWTIDGLPDFCGKCTNCVRIAQAGDLDARFAEAVEARENLRETDKKETRLFVQTHPDVLVIPPDPPQMMIKVDQVRRVIETIYYRPAEGRERVYIFTDSAFMKEAANSLLKVLEEPPEFATIFLLTENPGELLPTIRSRSMVLTLGALSAEEIERDLEKHHPEWKAAQRALVARLSEGAVGRARSFDLAAYTAARDHALAILKSALRGGEHSELFKITGDVPSGGRGAAEDRGADSYFVFAAARSGVHRFGRSGVGTEYGHCDGVEAVGGVGGFCLDHRGVGPFGRSGARHAAKSVAIVVAGRVRGRAGKIGWSVGAAAVLVSFGVLLALADVNRRISK